MSLRYEQGVLCLGEEKAYSLQDLAQKHGPDPFYVYDLQGILKRVRHLKKHSPALGIHYALKANGNRGLLRALAHEAIGVDTVSGGEIQKALEAGFTPDKILFSGVGKTQDELAFAVSLGIKQINVESPAELRRIATIAKQQQKKVSIAFRMNPDVNAETHPYITTGFRENKFGMDESFLPELLTLVKGAEHVWLKGLTIHIGSQIRKLEVLQEAFQKIETLFHALNADGHKLTSLDLGGGLGIAYEEEHKFPSEDYPLLEKYSALVQKIKVPELLCEPGRIFVASAGTLIGEVQYCKKTPYKNFLILNTGIHHLLRPALYQAKHRVLSLRAPKSLKECIPYDVVGPICESSDILARDVLLPPMQEGDFVAIADAGAYGFTMASSYNDHALPKEVLL